MIVYFEDGPLIASRQPPGELDDIIWIDAKDGYSKVNKLLNFVYNYKPSSTKVYTNSLEAFSNFYTWDVEAQTAMIYIRNKRGNWTLIRELTTRELRAGHSLRNMYISGEFTDV